MSRVIDFAPAMLYRQALLLVVLVQVDGFSTVPEDTLTARSTYKYNTIRGEIRDTSPVMLLRDKIRARFMKAGEGDILTCSTVTLFSEVADCKEVTDDTCATSYTVVGGGFQNCKVDASGLCKDHTVDFDTNPFGYDYDTAAKKYNIMQYCDNDCIGGSIRNNDCVDTDVMCCEVGDGGCIDTCEAVLVSTYPFASN